MEVIDLIGQRFGKLTVVARAENDKYGKARWVCKCDCGGTTISCGSSLRGGLSKSCGCIRNEKIKYVNYKHGGSNTRLFHRWMDIKHRCYNPKDKYYSIYGGRGIVVCEEWLNSFESFRDWAIQNGYTDDLTIDRINTNGNYEPSNCRWVSFREQANNTRRNRIVEYHGEKDTLTNMCRKLNVSPKIIYGRMKNGRRTFEQAVDDFEKTAPFLEYWELPYGRKKSI